MNRLNQTPEYVAWKGLKYRCNNPNCADYSNYGGRGISYDPKWDEFRFFIADMGFRPSLRHSLDRIDANGDYCKANCRWATDLEQQNNRRDNLVIEWNGGRFTAAQLARVVGLPRMTVVKRCKLGWPVEKIVKTPNATRRK